MVYIDLEQPMYFFIYHIKVQNEESYEFYRPVGTACSEHSSEPTEMSAMMPLSEK